jgi:hypothetical protein
MITVRLNTIDMVVTPLFPWFVDDKERGWPWPPPLDALRGYFDLNLLGLGFLAQRQPDR